MPRRTCICLFSWIIFKCNYKRSFRTQLIHPRTFWIEEKSALIQAKGRETWFKRVNATEADEVSYEVDNGINIEWLLDGWKAGAAEKPRQDQPRSDHSSCIYLSSLIMGFMVMIGEGWIIPSSPQDCFMTRLGTLGNLTLAFKPLRNFPTDTSDNRQPNSEWTSLSPTV